MYSYEIQSFLQERNYMLNKDEYLKVTDMKLNPQLSHIKYNPFKKDFSIKTNDGYSWIVKIK